MPLARPGSAIEPAKTPTRHVEIPVKPPGLDLRPIVRSGRLPGPSDPKSIAGQTVGLKKRTRGMILQPALDVARYGVRLVDLDGRTGDEIALLSADVAGAIKEVSSHSSDLCGFELWREGRLILRFYPPAETTESGPGGTPDHE